MTDGQCKSVTRLAAIFGLLHQRGAFIRLQHQNYVGTCTRKVNAYILAPNMKKNRGTHNTDSGSRLLVSRETRAWSPRLQLLAS